MSPKPFVDHTGYGVSRQYKSVSRWNQLPPLPLEDDAARKMPVNTETDYVEAFWHGHLCECPWCRDEPTATALKDYRAYVLHLNATPVGIRPPAVPDLPRDRLQAYETQVRSILDRRRRAYTASSEWQPYDQARLETPSRSSE